MSAPPAPNPTHDHAATIHTLESSINKLKRLVVTLTSPTPSAAHLSVLARSDLIDISQSVHAALAILRAGAQPAPPPVAAGDLILDQRVEDLGRQLANRNGRIAHLEQRLARESEHVSDLQTRLARAQAIAGERAEYLDQRTRTIEHLERQVDGLRQEVSFRDRGLQEMTDAKDTLRAQLAQEQAQTRAQLSIGVESRELAPPQREPPKVGEGIGRQPVDAAVPAWMIEQHRARSPPPAPASEKREVVVIDDSDSDAGSESDASVVCLCD